MPYVPNQPCSTYRTVSVLFHIPASTDTLTLHQHQTNDQHDNNKYRCPDCALDFFEFPKLLTHFKKDHDPNNVQKLYACFKWKRIRNPDGPNLNHERRNHRDESCVCDICGFKSVSLKCLKRHQVVHQSERPAQCQLCPASFKRVVTLKKHQSVHQEKKFECAHCGTKFRLLYGLREHILAKHLGYDCVKTKFDCKICTKKFGNRRDLVHHIRGHTGELLECKMCSKKFKQAASLRNHMRNKHEGRAPKCVYCKRTFSTKSRLKEHLFIHRGNYVDKSNICA
jgi:KRAB domain-containing zinc finger protein